MMGLGRLLTWLSGARPEILRQCPTDRAKYLGIGAAIFITSSMAAVSMTFALHMALKVPVAGAVPFALAWGLAIMSIDRWLVVSLQRQRNPWSYLPMALLRLALGLLFGFIISTPFVLQIFRPEIDQAITTIQDQRTSAYFHNLNTDPLSKRIAGERATAHMLENTIATGGGAITNPYDDPKIKALEQQLSAAQKASSTDYKEWQCQLYGIPRGRCKPGNGVLARASQQRYAHDQAQVHQLQAKIAAAVQQIKSADQTNRQARLSQAKAALPAARAALRADVATQSAQTAAFTSKNAQDTGLLMRLQALDNVTAQGGALAATRWLLFALFTTIECLPILVKILLNLGPETTYEKLLAAEERNAMRIAEEKRHLRRAAEMLEAQSNLRERQILLDEREVAMPQITREAIAAETRVARARLEDWERREMDGIRTGVWGGSRPRSRPAPRPGQRNSGRPAFGGQSGRSQPFSPPGPGVNPNGGSMPSTISRIPRFRRGPYRKGRPGL